MPDLPEDRPTEPLRPRQPVVAEPAVAPAAAAVDPGWMARIEDQIRSLKSMMALIGVLALAALGIALYDLLTDDEGDGRGASRERVAQLDERVDRLEGKAGGASEEADVTRLQEGLEGKAEKSDVEDLGTQIEELRAAVEAGGSDDALAEDLATLSEQVEQLAAEVEELRNESQQP